MSKTMYFSKKTVLRILSFVISFSMLLSCLFCVQANELDNPETETEIEEYDASTQYYNLSIPAISQGVYYYCGPACIYMIEHYLNPNSTHSIGDIADIMNITSSGTSSTQIYTYLNQNVVSSGSYMRCSYSNVNRSTRMRSSIQNGYPVAVSVHTMPYRTYGTPDTGHFILVKGFAYNPYINPSIYDVIFNDPYDGVCYTQYTFSQLDYGCASLTGYYVYHQ